MTSSNQPFVLPLSPLAQAVRNGVVLALEERKAATVAGGGAIGGPLIPTLSGAVAGPPTEPTLAC